MSARTALPFAAALLFVSACSDPDRAHSADRGASETSSRASAEADRAPASDEPMDPRADFGPWADVDSASIDGYRLSVGESGASCRLGYRGPADSGWMSLGVPPPCRFHRGTDGDVRALRVRGARLLLIQSSAPAAGGSGDCRTRIQGLRLPAEEAAEGADGRLEISGAVSSVTSCPPFQWDDVMFRGFWEEGR